MDSTGSIAKSNNRRCNLSIKHVRCVLSIVVAIVVITIGLACLLAVHPNHPSLQDIQNQYTVTLDYLAIRPNVSARVRSYWNIPYAATAGGQNRFRGPQPLNRTYGLGHGVQPLEWDGSLGSCPRIQEKDATLRNRDDISGPDVLGINTHFTEDCLSLNVFTPVDASLIENLPVVVDFPGGGFQLPGRDNGGGLVEKSRGHNAVLGSADKGIIVVSFYYRNGIYGFLSGERIANDGDYNNGLRDQRAVLEWVQKYIRNFGGNPNHVVLLGTSAGAASVLLQLTANEGDHYYAVPGIGRKPLFHGAIIESPPSPTFFTPGQAENNWKEVADGLNCTDIVCVRAASPGDVYFENYPQTFAGRKTPAYWSWAPTIEPAGRTWTQTAPEAIFAGRFAKVPTIIGFTTNEGTDQVDNSVDSVGAFKSFLADQYPLLTDDDLSLLAKTYPNDRQWPDSGRYWDAVAKAQGDLRYICPTYLSSNAIAQHNPSSVPTYQYEWNVIWGSDMTNGYGTKHAGTVGQIMIRQPNTISDYFLSFIKHLDPNVDATHGAAVWEKLDSRARRLFFTNLKDGAKRGDAQDMLGPVRTYMADMDEARNSRCATVFSGLMDRLQMANVEALGAGG